MSIDKSVLHQLQERIDNLQRRMSYDANDLDYETHKQQRSELQKILSRLKSRRLKLKNKRC